MQINNLFKKLLPKKANEIISKNKISISDVLNSEKINNSTISNQDINIGTGNTIDKSTTNNYYIIQETPESHLTSDNSETLVEKIKPIEELISFGLTYKAIKAYNQLIYDNFDVGLSINDRFSIYNGLLTCYVNIDENEEMIKSWINKIEALGQVKELHRFLYIQSVYYYNKQDIPKAIHFNDKALEIKSNYLNAILFKVFLNSANKRFKYKDAIERITSLRKYTTGKIKEITSMKNNLGDI